MKNSDYITLGFIAVFVTIIAYFVVNSILGVPGEKGKQVDFAPSISSDVEMPDTEVFNAAAINPTVEVYTGSCEDTNHDGSLDESERKACGLDSMETGTGGSTNPDYLESNNGLSNEENENENTENGYARNTSAQQREEVENDVEAHTREQQEQEQSGNEADRRETVSGS